MTKRQLIDEILTINRSASPRFLARFADDQLDEYLGHLRLLQTPRLDGDAGRYDKYFRDCPTISAVRADWRADQKADEPAPGDALADRQDDGDLVPLAPAGTYEPELAPADVAPADTPDADSARDLAPLWTPDAEETGPPAELETVTAAERHGLYVQHVEAVDGEDDDGYAVEDLPAGAHLAAPHDYSAHDLAHALDEAEDDHTTAVATPLAAPGGERELQPAGAPAPLFAGQDTTDDQSDTWLY